MSTARPLPLQPLPPPTVTEHEQHRRRREVAERLQEHRRRRPQARGSAAQPALPGIDLPSHNESRSRGLADSVAARFAKTVSYRDFLQQEAEAAVRQAEAAAEGARRNAEAIADAQQRLLDDMEQWSHVAETPAMAQQAIVEQHTSPSHREATLVAMMPVAAEPAVAALTQTATAQQPQASFAAVLSEAMVKPAEQLTRDLFVDEPVEPTTSLPTNLIEFPRQLVAARKARPRLAEGPLRDEADTDPERAQLRIFEVEASSFSTTPTVEPAGALPEWSNIRLDSWQAPHAMSQPEAQVSLAMPVYTAPVSQRCMAAAVDACCIGVVFLLAVAAAAYASPELPEGKFALMAAAGTLVIFGVLYLLLFFTFSEGTPGMRYARIALCTFGDDNPTRSAMRRRLLAMALSVVPLGMGFAWAMLDEDRLSWHDRISRMYQRAY